MDVGYLSGWSRVRVRARSYLASGGMCVMQHHGTRQDIIDWDFQMDHQLVGKRDCDSGSAVATRDSGLVVCWNS